MHLLILGSYPPHKNKWDYEFYYPNNQNRFWKVLAKLAGFEITENKGEAAVRQRKKLMSLLKIGGQNLGLLIYRNGESSLDKDITMIEYQDIFGIISEHKELKTILLSGYSGKSSTYHSFIDYLKLKKIQYDKPLSVKAGEKFYIYYQRPILCMIGNSTSSRAGGTVSFDKLVDQFQDAIEV